MAVAVKERDGAAAFLEEAAHFCAVVLECFAFGGDLGEESFVSVYELFPVFVTDDLQVADHPTAVCVVPVNGEAEEVALAVEVGEKGEGTANDGAEVAAAVAPRILRLRWNRITCEIGFNAAPLNAS